MVIKTYEMQMLGYESTFPVMVNEKKEYISFKKASLEEGDGYLHTNRKELQTAIEASDKFQKGEITLIKTIGNDEDDDFLETALQLKEYPGISDFLEAREILLNEPYNVSPQKLQKSPQAVTKKAAELGVAFPQLVKSE